MSCENELASGGGESLRLTRRHPWLSCFSWNHDNERKSEQKKNEHAGASHDPGGNAASESSAIGGQVIEGRFWIGRAS